MAGVHSHKVVLTDVVGQVGEDQSSLLGLVDRRAVDLDVVALTIDVNLLLLVVDDVS